jgi:hypothetical protein
VYLCRCRRCEKKVNIQVHTLFWHLWQCWNNVVLQDLSLLRLDPKRARNIHLVVYCYRIALIFFSLLLHPILSFLFSVCLLGSRVFSAIIITCRWRRRYRQQTSSLFAFVPPSSPIRRKKQNILAKRIVWRRTFSYQSICIQLTQSCIHDFYPKTSIKTNNDKC